MDELGRSQAGPGINTIHGMLEASVRVTLYGLSPRVIGRSSE